MFVAHHEIARQSLLVSYVSTPVPDAAITSGPFLRTALFFGAPSLIDESSGYFDLLINKSKQIAYLAIDWILHRYTFQIVRFNNSSDE